MHTELALVNKNYKQESANWLFLFNAVDAWSLAFSPDSQYLATGSHVGKVNIFGVETGKKEYSLDTRGKFILSIAYVRSTIDNFLCEITIAVVCCKSGGFVSVSLALHNTKWQPCFDSSKYKLCDVFPRIHGKYTLIWLKCILWINSWICEKLPREWQGGI